ncbi:MAG TPA: carboxylating nicotinate-nucleotide diphosphorylase [Thermoanaerobaculia bacterium]|nr:carboxylating nicotinate-nucleotide diphosphorylase [Thermoanaerobaculia bacterium]
MASRLSVRSTEPAGLVLPPRLVWEETVRRGLAEDLGQAGDLTTDAIVPPNATARGRLIARQAGCVAGIGVAAVAFELLDPAVRFEAALPDGARVRADATLATVEGSARALLTGERVALNLLGRLSGIATATRLLVDTAGGPPPWIVCTRKTTPGLRALEKYAVRAGGGANHRFGLDDAVLIKDNHVALAGGVREAIDRVRRHVGHLVEVEVEVDDLDQLREALAAGAEAVLLDNMELAALRAAVDLCRGRALTEASGGIRPETVAAVAATGVDLISVGWLTHSAPALDVAMELDR